jgi:hypothetical protein
MFNVVEDCTNAVRERKKRIAEIQRRILEKREEERYMK